MLYTIIPLAKDLSHLENRVFIERSLSASTMFLYLFYGDKIFQYVRFEPDNLMMQTRDGIRDIFLPTQCVGENRVHTDLDNADRSI